MHALINRSGVYNAGEFHDFDHMRVREDTAHSFYNGATYLHPWEGVTEPIDPLEGHKQGKYSWAKSPRYEVPGTNGKVPLEAGPLARQVIAGRPMPRRIKNTTRCSLTQYRQLARVFWFASWLACMRRRSTSR